MAVQALLDHIARRGKERFGVGALQCCDRGCGRREISSEEGSVIGSLMMISGHTNVVKGIDCVGSWDGGLSKVRSAVGELRIVPYHRKRTVGLIARETGRE